MGRRYRRHGQKRRLSCGPPHPDPASAPQGRAFVDDRPQGVSVDGPRPTAPHRPGKTAPNTGLVWRPYSRKPAPRNLSARRSDVQPRDAANGRPQPKTLSRFQEPDLVLASFHFAAILGHWHQNSRSKHGLQAPDRNAFSHSEFSLTVFGLNSAPKGAVQPNAAIVANRVL